MHLYNVISKTVTPHSHPHFPVETRNPLCYAKQDHASYRNLSLDPTLVMMKIYL